MQMEMNISATLKMAKKMEMAFLSGMMDAFASVISNNLNIVMKFLATVTIVLSIPTMIASFFGMNFDNIPLGHSPFGFFTIIVLTLIISGVVALLFRKKDLF